MKTTSPSLVRVGQSDVFLITVLITFWGSLVLWQSGGLSPVLVAWLLAGIIGLWTTRAVAFKASSPAIVEKSPVRAGFKPIFSIGEGLTLLLLSALLLGLLKQHAWLMGLSVSGLLLMKSYYSLRRQRQRKRLLAFYWKVYLGSGWLPYVLALVALVLTGSLAGLLYAFGPGFLRVGLLDRATNVTMLPLMQAHQLGGRQMGVFVFCALLLLLPALAFGEEQLFRRGRVQFTQLLHGAIIFGLVHGLAGIPLYAAMGLIGTGICFSWFYRFSYDKLLNERHSERQAELLALWPVTSMHTIYNTLLIVMAYVFILIG